MSWSSSAYGDMSGQERQLHDASLNTASVGDAGWGGGAKGDQYIQDPIVPFVLLGFEFHDYAKRDELVEGFVKRITFHFTNFPAYEAIEQAGIDKQGFVDALYCHFRQDIELEFVWSDGKFRATAWSQRQIDTVVAKIA